jgi:hypothetical protein
LLSPAIGAAARLAKRLATAAEPTETELSLAEQQIIR